MEKELLREARKFTQYVSHNDIVELVKSINFNELDGNRIKQLLTDCLSKLFQELPIQNDILKKEVFNTFCLMLKNAETGIIPPPSFCVFRSDEEFSLHSYNDKPTIGKLTPIAAILVDEWINNITKQKLIIPNQQPQQIQLSENLLQLLQQRGYIESTTKPYMWIKTNRKTVGINLNKAAIFDLLCLLEYPDEIITNVKLLNEYFVFPNNKPIRANNLTYHKDHKGKLKRPIISEYHTELEFIVAQSKGKVIL